MMGPLSSKSLALVLMCSTLTLHAISIEEAQKGIFETGHNLLRGLPTTSAENDKESCVWCHIPHDSLTMDTQPPKWSAQSGSDTSFSVYGIVDDNSSKSSLSGPDVMVRVCLTCHDGINAPNISLYSDSSLNTFNVNTASSGGGTFVHSHPVGIEYLPTSISGVKASLKPESTVLKEWSGAKTIHDLISDGTVKCTSCHDPHTTNDQFLRTPNKYSQLCKGCHNK